MEAIRLTKTIARPIADWPELDGLVGSEVEVIVLIKSVPKKVGPKAGSGRGHLTLHPGWDAPLEDFKDYL